MIAIYINIAFLVNNCSTFSVMIRLPYEGVICMCSETAVSHTWWGQGGIQNIPNGKCTRSETLGFDQ